jgi:hypothetical protein
MTQPARRLIVAGAQRLTDQAQQSIEQFQREAYPRAAIGFAGKSAAGEVRNMIAGRVAMQDL